ncbi:MAG: diacylglycerol kinase family lipid kinase [Butyrivibrio sp.]|nr:diacylglycerol kinase family lipid kinase [Butyrivibrio sp.]
MYYIIVNPSSQSGRGIRIWQKLKPVFIEKNIPYELMLSTHAGHIAEITDRLTQNDTNVNLIILGGDGTINEALQGIRDFSKVSIGYIPTGSSNDLARAMHIGKNPLKTLETILSGKAAHMVDIGVLEFDRQECTESKYVQADFPDKRYFVVSSGIGFDAAVCEEALSSSIKDVLNKLKLGKLTYLGVALKQLIAAKSIACDMYLDGKEPVHAERFLFIAAMIHKYEGGGFKFCPNADASDGVLDICFVGKIPKPLILLALPTAFFGKHYMFPHITPYRARKIEIKTSAPLWVHTDGEVYFKSSHIYLSCEKQKIKFLA